MNLSLIFLFIFVFSSGFTITHVFAEFQLLVVHNNDMHSRFEETNAYGAPCSSKNKAQNRCYGGFARTKRAIKEAVEEANRNNIPHLVLNAGDSFQGSPYYEMKKGQIVQPLLDSLSIDVMTLGNHEFDYGINILAEYLKSTKIPIVCCNLNLTTEPRLILPNLTPSKIFDVNATKVGVIGFLTPDTMFLSKTENLDILDEIEPMKAEAKRLKEEGVNIIIGLGHSGFEREKEIAREVPHLSLMVGGHSHSLLYSPKEKPPSVEPAIENYPFIVTQKSGRRVPVVQAGAFTKYVGKLMVIFDDDGGVISATGNTQLLNSSVNEDQELKNLTDYLLTPLRGNLKEMKAYTRVPLLLSDFSKHEYESNLGNFLTDALVDYAIRRPYTDNDERWTTATITILCIGSIRGQIDISGPITLEDILMIFPFADTMYEVQYKGWVIRNALERGVQSKDFNEFLYFSGLKVVYNLTNTINNRVSSVDVLCSMCSVPRYETLQDNETYTILIGSYLLNGNAGFTMFRDEKLNVQDMGVNDRDVVVEYLERKPVLYPILDGRITVKY